MSLPPYIYPAAAVAGFLLARVGKGGAVQSVPPGTPEPAAPVDPIAGGGQFDGGAGGSGGWLPSPDPWPVYPSDPLSPVPVVNPSPAPTPTSPAATTSWAPTLMGTPPAAATGAIVAPAGSYRFYVVKSGRITGFTVRTTQSAGFRAFTANYGTYPWPTEGSKRILVKIISGGAAGRYLAPGQAGVRYYRKA